MSDDAPITSRSGERLPASAAPPPSATRPFVFILGNVLERLVVHEMPPTERAVLTWIATHADRNGANAYPSIARLSRLTGFGVSTIVRAIEALVKRRWLLRVARWDERSKGATSNLYTVLLDGEPWGDEQALKRRRTPPPLRQRAGGGPLREAEGPSSPDDRPPLRQAVTPSSPGGNPLFAVRQGTSHDPPMILPFEQKTKIAQSRGGEGVGGQEQLTLIPPAPSAPPAPPPAAPRSQSPKAPKVKAADGYGQAWVDGHGDAGVRVSRPAASGIACLGRAAAAHARYRDGEPITGEELQRWIRVKARKFREEVEDPARQRGGMTPFGFVQWLDDDPDTRAQPWRRPEERSAPPVAPAPEPLPVYTLADQELALKFQRRLQGLPDLAPEDLTAAAQAALQARGQVAHG